jgi:hypothetical protein
VFDSRNIIADLWKEMTLGKIIASAVLIPLLGAMLVWSLGGWPDWVRERADHIRDDWTCRGRAAQAEGDRLSALAEKELKAKDVARAQDLFRDANRHYEKAYACPGFPDAGIRLAVAHCMGFGVQKSQLKARQYVLEIEKNHPTSAGRAGDVRKLCGM